MDLYYAFMLPYAKSLFNEQENETKYKRSQSYVEFP